MLRHFAFFNATTFRRIDDDGRASDVCPYIREFKGEIPDPPPMSALIQLSEMERQQVMRAWQDTYSGREPHEICLDVTSFDYPEGDFCWMVFRPYEQTEPGKFGLLDWPDQHTFVQIDRATMRLQTYGTSPRPVRSCSQRIVVDITGTAWEQFYRQVGALYGTFEHRDGAWHFRPDNFQHIASILAAQTDLDRQYLERQPRRALDAASPDLTPIDISTLRQPELVPADRSA